MARDQHISVAMCTYNGSRFLAEQLASIAAQTRLPLELVICDDGSTDNTSEIVEEFAHLVSFPVRFIRNSENLGSTKNFEKCIGLCTGDLIALCDQDDVWLPEKLARQADTLEHDSEWGGVFSDALLINENSESLGEKLWASILFSSREQTWFETGRSADVLLKKNVVTGATMMFRASLRPLIFPIPASWVHDGWIAWMLIMYSKLKFIAEPLVRYRLHASQQVGIEAVALSRSLSLRERLLKGSREEPARHLSAAGQFKDLERRLTSHEGKNSTVLPLIHEKIKFLSGRGSAYKGDLARMAWILGNANNYWRYENGLKCFVRDIVMISV